MIDQEGFRQNVGIILVNQSHELFWGRRVGHNAWQFPQGGIMEHEKPIDALYRELHEEIGLEEKDVELLGSTKHWIKYRLPKQFLRSNSKPLVIGQKQKWYLLKLISDESKIKLDSANKPEFDHWQWVNYWLPIKEVIYFKRHVYKKVLKEFSSLLNVERDET